MTLSKVEGMTQQCNEMRENQTAIVVGAGIVGLCCAHQLQRAGYTVTIIDREEIGLSTAAGSCGILATTHVAPVALPGSLGLAAGAVDGPGPVVIRSRYIKSLLPFLVPFYASSQPDTAEEISKKLSQVNRLAVESLEEILQDVDAGDLLQHRGWLYVYETDEGFGKAQLELDFRRRRGWSVETMSGDEAREMEPALTPEIRHAAYLPEAADLVDPAEAMRRIAQALTARGGTILLEEITALAQDAEGDVILQTSAGTHRASVIVLAAGPWTSEMISKFGVTIPHAPEAGSSVTFHNPEITLQYPISSGEHKCVINVVADGMRITTGADFTDLSAPPDYGQSARLAAVAKRLLPGLRDRSFSRWYGVRSLMPDSLPTIGRVPGYRNLILAYGHGHLGITLAGVTGKLVRSLAIGEPPLIDPGFFSADRFQAWFQPSSKTVALSSGS